VHERYDCLAISDFKYVLSIGSSLQRERGSKKKLENFHELGSYYYNEKDPNR
jgi:hypothetical protein